MALTKCISARVTSNEQLFRARVMESPCPLHLSDKLFKLPPNTIAMSACLRFCLLIVIALSTFKLNAQQGNALLTVKMTTQALLPNHFRLTSMLLAIAPQPLCR
jgi:hypothetical protein